jgi:hypothetical protein
MKRLVELHFERCLIALTARKESHLCGLDNKVNVDRMNEHLSSSSFFSPYVNKNDRKTHPRISNQVETSN